MDSETRHALRMWSIFILVPCLLMAAIGVGATVAEANQYAPAKTTCFSAADWDADTADIPCTTVLRPDNDVVQVIQGTASKDMGICTISTSEVGDAWCNRIKGIIGPPPVLNTHGSKRDCNPTSHVCIKVGTTQEDGSVAVTVYQFNMLRPIERCVLPNVTEERGTYTAPCYPLGPAIATVSS